MAPHLVRSRDIEASFDLIGSACFAAPLLLSALRVVRAYRRPAPAENRPARRAAARRPAAAVPAAPRRCRSRAARRRSARPRTGRRPSSASPPGVVTIQIDSTRAFDTEWNTTAQATGFVIDAKRGLILTNRHVVTPGPGHRAGDLPEPRGGAALPGLPRSRARLRHLSLRSREAALHPAGGAAAVSGGRRDRAGDPRGRQRCRRTAVDPRRYSRAPRSRGARNTATASTTTSTRSTTRPHRAPPAARPARRSSISRAAWWRSTPAARPARRRASICRCRRSRAR